jgi:hypothetical protein
MRTKKTLENKYRETNKIRLCKDCGEELSFMVRDCDLYEEGQFIKPTLCKTCINKRKLAKNNYTLIAVEWNKVK